MLFNTTLVFLLLCQGLVSPLGLHPCCWAKIFSAKHAWHEPKQFHVFFWSFLKSLHGPVGSTLGVTAWQRVFWGGTPPKSHLHPLKNNFSKSHYPGWTNTLGISMMGRRPPHCCLWGSCFQKCQWHPGGKWGTPNGVGGSGCIKVQVHQPYHPRPRKLK